MLVAWQQSLSIQPDLDNLHQRLSPELWQEVVRKLKPLKASGPDGIQGFWWKTFSIANSALYKPVPHHLTSGNPLPHGWIANARTILLHKSGPKSDPFNFRPITCLNTCYKLLRGFISTFIGQYVSERNMVAIEQRALQKNIWGCTHAPTVDQTLIADAHDQKQRPISVAWIDYAKAFDSIPHTYIKWVLRSRQVPPPLRKLLKGLMNQWQVKYEVKVKGGKVNQSNYLKTRAEILQRDSFSPLLFCLGMVPLSHALNSCNIQYTTTCGKQNKL